MKRLTVILCILVSSLSAQDTLENLDAPDDDLSNLIFQAPEVEYDEVIWVYRVLLVFADNPNDPRVNEQLGLIENRPGELLERDVIVIIDTNPQTESSWRAQFHPNGFGIVLLSKDGNVVFRKPRPWTVREITRSIDKLPLRQQEMQIEN